MGCCITIQITKLHPFFSLFQWLSLAALFDNWKVFLLGLSFSSSDQLFFNIRWVGHCFPKYELSLPYTKLQPTLYLTIQIDKLHFSSPSIKSKPKLPFKGKSENSSPPFWFLAFVSKLRQRNLHQEKKKPNSIQVSNVEMTQHGTVTSTNHEKIGPRSQPLRNHRPTSLTASSQKEVKPQSKFQIWLTPCNITFSLFV